MVLYFGHRQGSVLSRAARSCKIGTKLQTVGRPYKSLDFFSWEEKGGLKILESRGRHVIFRGLPFSCKLKKKAQQGFFFIKIRSITSATTNCDLIAVPFTQKL